MSYTPRPPQVPRRPIGPAPQWCINQFDNGVLISFIVVFSPRPYTIKSVLSNVLEDALEHVGCEGRNWSWIGFFVFFVCFAGEADEQHCLAGEFELLLADEQHFLAGEFELLLAFACFHVYLDPLALHPDCTAILASVVTLNVVLQRKLHVKFHSGVLYKFFGLIRAPAAQHHVHPWHAWCKILQEL